MEKTETGLDKAYLDFVYELHNTMLDKRILLVYEGEVNQMITKAFTALAEKNLDDTEEGTTLKKRVYHVMVECLQNLCKHADDIETGDPVHPGSGLFLVSETEAGYSVTSGNVVSNEKVESLRETLTEINEKSKEELKDMKKKQLRESRLSEKGGAGLGFIDIVKRTGNRIFFDFQKMNDKTSFFVMNSQVTR